MYRFLTAWPKQKPTEQDLPDPSISANPKEVERANSNVIEVIKTAEKSKKRGKYSNYDDEFRTKIARYAIENGDAAAVRKFSPQLRKTLNESTVRTWRKFVINKESVAKANVALLEKEKRGRPMLLGIDLDEKVCFL